MQDRVKIRIQKKHPEYLIKDFARMNINLYSISQKEDQLEVVISKEDLEILQKRKTIQKFQVIDYYGTSRLLQLLKQNSLFIICFMIGIFFTIFLSQFIWNIEIETPNPDLQKIVLKDLKEFGLKKYDFKISTHKKSEIKEKLKEKEKDKIEWLEVEEVGTLYKIKIEEKRLQEESTCQERNIIAGKNARITKIEASSGEVMKKKNDYVTKGEVIISGFIYNKEEVVSKKCAEGKVYGETWYKVMVEVPKEKVSLQKNKKSSIGLEIILFQKDWIYPQKYKNYEKNEYNIIKGKILPFQVNLLKQFETVPNRHLLSTKDIEKTAIKEGIKELERSLSKEPVVLRKNVLKKTTKNSKIIVEVFFALEEEITSYQDISNIEIEKMNQEKEG